MMPASFIPAQLRLNWGSRKFAPSVAFTNAKTIPASATAGQLTTPWWCEASVPATVGVGITEGVEDMMASLDERSTSGGVLPRSGEAVAPNEIAENPRLRYHRICRT